mmetsp:Transcript_3702/g.10013  ORF Transcript_3702/g.10013 Transcript_3702/m.10013 type:complete len:202 (-) Transcript_3702:998-1603(-)
MACCPTVRIAGSLVVRVRTGPPNPPEPRGMFVMFVTFCDGRLTEAWCPQSTEESTEGMPFGGLALERWFGMVMDIADWLGSLQSLLRRGLKLSLSRSWCRCFRAALRMCSMEDVRSRDSRSLGPTRSGWMLSKRRGLFRPSPRSIISADQRFLVLEPKCTSVPLMWPAASATRCAASGRAWLSFRASWAKGTWFTLSAGSL